MNWNKPDAVEPFARILGSKPDSTADTPAIREGSIPNTLAEAMIVSLTLGHPLPRTCGTVLPSAKRISPTVVPAPPLPYTPSAAPGPCC